MNKFSTTYRRWTSWGIFTVFSVLFRSTNLCTTFPFFFRPIVYNPTNTLRNLFAFKSFQSDMKNLPNYDNFLLNLFKLYLHFLEWGDSKRIVSDDRHRKNKHMHKWWLFPFGELVIQLKEYFLRYIKLDEGKLHVLFYDAYIQANNWWPVVYSTPVKTLWTCANCNSKNK